MPDLREQLQSCLQGRVCFVGLGNVEYGDDAFGVRLAERLKAEGSEVVIAGTESDRHIGHIADAGYDHVIFLDAVEFGGAPGSVVFLDSAEMASRFPQISTHKISLGTLAQCIESNGATRVWLLGAQPASLKQGAGLSVEIERTMRLLVELLAPKALDCCENRSFLGIERDSRNDQRAVVLTAVQSLRLQRSEVVST